jgi:hypothetical protein
MTGSKITIEKLLIEGGGFPAFWYSFGYGKQMLRQITPKFIAGYSAGSDTNTHGIMELFYSTSRCCNICALESLIRTTMSACLPNNIHDIANGKLGVILCATNNNHKCKMVIHWESKEELIDCLVASCYIPFMMNGCNTSDERYGCRDAIFSRDLDHFTKEFDYIIRKEQPNNGALHFIENIISIAPGEAVDLVYHGELACAYDVDVVTETTNILSDTTEKQLIV